MSRPRIAGVALPLALLVSCKTDAPEDADGDAASRSGEAMAKPGEATATPSEAKPSEANTTPSTAPSCASQRPGAGRSCGVEGTTDCCAHAPVPGGTFKRSFDAVNCTDPNFPATVDAFELDVHEVTVGRFRMFLDAGQGTRATPPTAGAGAHPKHPDSGWSPAWNQSLAASRSELESALACGPGASWTPTPGANETLPINCVSYYEALAFCAWDGGFLPTEAERNHVASGGDEQRVFPWSTPPESMHIGPEHAVYGSPATAPVGTHRQGDGRWGHADLAGNVWEWTIDEVELAKVLPTQGANFCEPAGMPVPCIDCAATGVSSARVLRGGGWGLPERGMAVSIRRGGEPEEREHVFGIRCARPTGDTKVEDHTCTPSCAERVCGDDGCGGSCGSCDGTAVCHDGRCELVEYPAGPFGVGVGEVFPNLRLSAIADASREPDVMQELALAEYVSPGGGEQAPRLAIYFTTDWTETDRTRELIDWAKARATTDVLIVLLEGQRRGQPADSGNLRAFALERALAVPAAMDTLGELPAALREHPRPQVILIDRADMKVLSSTDPDDLDAWSKLIDAKG